MNIKGPGYQGDIVIGNPHPANIFPDPSAYELEDCEYILYVYRMHKRKARRTWGGIIDNLNPSASHYETEIFQDRDTNLLDDETVQVIEYWYRQPSDGSANVNGLQYEWNAGDIACSIQVEFKEVQWIPNYWEKTSKSGNNRFPFIKYCKIPVEKSFWDMSEIESIKDLIDGADITFLNSL
jgi:hypothetical protein